MTEIVRKPRPKKKPTPQHLSRAKRANPEVQIDEFYGDAWQRQPHEPPKPWSAFTIYRDMGHERALTAAMIEYKTINGLKIPPKLPTGGQRIESTFFLWSKKFRWSERVELFDNHLDSEIILKQKHDRIRVSEQHADQAARATAILMRPITKLEERIEQMVAGLRPDELEQISDMELARLVRSHIDSLPRIQQAHREALEVTQDTVVRVDEKQLRIRGEILRQIIGNPTEVDRMERVSFAIAEAENTVESTSTG